MRIPLDAMNGEERKSYIASVLMAKPEYLNCLAPKPFTTEDISKVISIIILVYLSILERYLCVKIVETLLKV